MRIQKWILAIALVIISGCATYGGARNQGHGFIINHEKNPVAYGSVSIEYKPYALLETEYRARYQNQMLEPAEIESKISFLPKGGYAVFTIKRITIDSANLSNFSFVVEHEGEIVQRENPEGGIPEVPGSDRFWWNVNAVPIMTPFTDEITLHVIDDGVSQSADHFVIKPPIQG